MRIMAGVEGLVQWTGDGRTCWLRGGRVIERSGGAVCGLYHAHVDEKHVFLGWPQNHSDGFLWFDLKTGGTVFFVLASKPVARVFRCGPQNRQHWFGAQNHHDGFLAWASKPSRLWFVGCATKPTEGGRHGTRVEIWQLASTGSKSH
jgi:hypothetical protein